MLRYDNSLFSTPVWHIKDGTPQLLVEDLYKNAYHCRDNIKGVQVSNVKGYQSPCFNWESFHPSGITCIKSIVDDILKDNIYKDFKVEGWWYNINPKGAFNKPHTHPYSDLALILYLTDSHECLSIMNPFTHLRPKLGIVQNKVIDGRKGDIIIFPSDIIHFVTPHEEETDRVSISMNLQLC